MKIAAALAITLLSLTLCFGQNEQSPIVEKDINYKNWTYKSVRNGEEAALRDLIRGKKLAIVVYYAPWCPNWKHDAPFLQRFYEKYKSAGLEIIAVAEYDPVDAMKANLESLKITFPAYYESTGLDDREKTMHHSHRRSVGDERKWGSPWYILIDPAAVEKKGDVLLKKAHVINGEMIETEGEKYIREKLGLPTQ